MLILKGKEMKSCIFDIIKHNSNSICYEYNNYPISDGGIYADSTQYSLSALLAEIDDMLIRQAFDMYDYLLIYTNIPESALIKFIVDLRRREGNYMCRQIILACAD